MGAAMGWGDSPQDTSTWLTTCSPVIMSRCHTFLRLPPTEKCGVCGPRDPAWLKLPHVNCSAAPLHHKHTDELLTIL